MRGPQENASLRWDLSGSANCLCRPTQGNRYERVSLPGPALIGRSHLVFAVPWIHGRLSRNCYLNVSATHETISFGCIRPDTNKCLVGPGDAGVSASSSGPFRPSLLLQERRLFPDELGFSVPADMAEPHVFRQGRTSGTFTLLAPKA